jgi:multidrug efflux pump subunit AcrB
MSGMVGAFLKNFAIVMVAATLASLLVSFTLTPLVASQIATGPLMRRYSKALEYDYSPALRKELLAEAGRFHGRDIDSAIAMLAQAAESAPLLASALQRAKPEN